MKCPGREAENREGRRFCAACGVALTAACSACGFSNEPDERFCGGCGGPLEGTVPATIAERPIPDAERRQLTVMFCDLVGSTALAGDLDPEELRAVIRAYQSVCGEVVSRFQGHIAQYLGDGLLIYFGYPVAHEDDAQRAVHTALGMIES